jgi:hypothetical protein
MSVMSIMDSKLSLKRMDLRSGTLDYFYKPRDLSFVLRLMEPKTLHRFIFTSAAFTKFSY